MLGFIFCSYTEPLPTPRSMLHERHAGTSFKYTRVYPKISGLAAWSENCKWYGSLPLGAVVSLFVTRIVSSAAITLYVNFQ
jgi:hypothetical protein